MNKALFVGFGLDSIAGSRSIGGDYVESIGGNCDDNHGPRGAWLSPFRIDRWRAPGTGTRIRALERNMDGTWRVTQGKKS
jgi:hypothetical protein